MGIQMELSSRLQVETSLKDPEGKQPERVGDAVSTADVSKTEAVTKAVKLVQVGGRTSVVKAGEASAGRRAAYDQYIPEKPEDTASFGYYRPVKGENGDTKIEFTKPTEEAVQTSDADQPVNSEQPADENGRVEMQEQGQNATEKRTEEKQDSDEQAGANMEQVSSGKNRVLELKTKKKQLERDIKAATDVRTASNLKRKLAQVEKALKAAAKAG